MDEQTNIYINPTWSFIIGWPQWDAWLTWRKIIVDTYWGIWRHGGGAFSWKDPSKVDRSGAYVARYIAKNIVASWFAKTCEVQLAYAIWVAKPVSIWVNTFNTGIISDDKIADIIEKVFPTKPADIIKKLRLKAPIYSKTASYWHFGRNCFPWEKLDKVDELKKLI
jgi:S-adenosylmethionine synthetase